MIGIHSREVHLAIHVEQFDGIEPHGFEEGLGVHHSPLDAHLADLDAVVSWMVGRLIIAIEEPQAELADLESSVIDQVADDLLGPKSLASLLEGAAAKTLVHVVVDPLSRPRFLHTNFSTKSELSNGKVQGSDQDNRQQTGHAPNCMQLVELIQ